MKYDKIKALLSLNKKNFTDYANYMNVSKQQLSNKKKSDSFKADELIKLAEMTGTILAFNDKNTGKPLIEFDISDLKSE
jgi:hypothetical protein